MQRNKNIYRNKNTYNILVTLHPGKKAKEDGQIKAIKGQEGFTCILKSLRRMAFFDQTNLNTTALNAYKKIKQAMMNFHDNYDELVQMGVELCKNSNIDIQKALNSDDDFMFYYCLRVNKKQTIKEFFDDLNSMQKWTVLYDILIEKIILPLMNIKNISWHPRDGFEALGESLKQHGAHAFLGKFGAYSHDENILPLPYKNETTHNRHVLYFKKGSYIGDSVPFAHCVVVDQVKVIEGKEFVFFRDPINASNSETPEKIYMLSYENFVNRLTNWKGGRYINNKYSDFTYGRVSHSPEKFGHSV